jgi:hypothetical protein
MYPEDERKARWGMIAHGNWRDLYQAAMLELCPEQLWLRIKVAEKSIQQRIVELQPCDSNSLSELRELDDALRGLRVLASTECLVSLPTTSYSPQGETIS